MVQITDVDLDRIQYLVNQIVTTVADTDMGGADLDIGTVEFTITREQSKDYLVGVVIPMADEAGDRRALVEVD